MGVPEALEEEWQQLTAHLGAAKAEAESAKAETQSLKAELSAAKAEAASARAEVESLKAEAGAANEDAVSARLAAEASRKQAQEEQGKLRSSLQWWRRTAMVACREKERLLDSLEKERGTELEQGQQANLRAQGPGEGSQGKGEVHSWCAAVAAQKGIPGVDLAGGATAGSEGGKDGAKGRVLALEEEVQRLKARLAAYQAAGAAQQRFPLQTEQSPSAGTGPLMPSGAPPARQGEAKGGPVGPAVRVHLVCRAQGPHHVVEVGEALGALGLEEDDGAKQGQVRSAAGAPQGAVAVYQGQEAGRGGGGGGLGCTRGTWRHSRRSWRR